MAFGILIYKYSTIAVNDSKIMSKLIVIIQSMGILILSQFRNIDCISYYQNNFYIWKKVASSVLGAIYACLFFYVGLELNKKYFLLGESFCLFDVSAKFIDEYWNFGSS